MLSCEDAATIHWPTSTITEFYIMDEIYFNEFNNAQFSLFLKNCRSS